MTHEKDLDALDDLHARGVLSDADWERARERATGRASETTDPATDPEAATEDSGAELAPEESDSRAAADTSHGAAPDPDPDGPPVAVLWSWYRKRSGAAQLGLGALVIVAVALGAVALASASDDAAPNNSDFEPVAMSDADLLDLEIDLCVQSIGLWADEYMADNINAVLMTFGRESYEYEVVQATALQFFRRSLQVGAREAFAEIEPDLRNGCRQNAAMRKTFLAEHPG